MAEHHTTRSRRKEQDVCLLGATYSFISSDETTATDFFCWYYAVVLVHSALCQIFPPLVSPRIFLSAQTRKIWMSFIKRCRGPTCPRLFFFFFQKKALYNLQRCKFTNPVYTACHLEEQTGTSRV